MNASDINRRPASPWFIEFDAQPLGWWATSTASPPVLASGPDRVGWRAVYVSEDPKEKQS